MIQKKKIEVITNTISKLQNPCNYNYLSKTLSAHLTISRGAQVENDLESYLLGIKSRFSQKNWFMPKNQHGDS